MRGEALSFDRAPSGRSQLAGGMARRLSGEGPRGTLLRSPRGWGRRGILEEAASTLRAAGRKVVEIDPDGFAVHPD
ncbi:MAG TPA: hypothetical protein VNI57_02945, partial [Candidatus Saccharimonadales bacterium]|nr:hypothetical protein [Candidatus Saccharimonadales bacterium]